MIWRESSGAIVQMSPVRVTEVSWVMVAGAEMSKTGLVGEVSALRWGALKEECGNGVVVETL